jgi:hypothetical protein
MAGNAGREVVWAVRSATRTGLAASIVEDRSGVATNHMMREHNAILWTRAGISTTARLRGMEWLQVVESSRKGVG